MRCWLVSLPFLWGWSERTTRRVRVVGMMMASFARARSIQPKWPPRSFWTDPSQEHAPDTAPKALAKPLDGRRTRPTPPLPLSVVAHAPPRRALAHDGVQVRTHVSVARNRSNSLASSIANARPASCKCVCLCKCGRSIGRSIGVCSLWGCFVCPCTPISSGKDLSDRSMMSNPVIDT